MTGSRALEMPRQRTGRRDSSPEPTQKVQSLILRLLVYGAAIFTFAVLAFLIGYILIKGIPYLTPDCSLGRITLPTARCCRPSSRLWK